MASAPGTGYTKLFSYDEEQRLIQIQHNTAGTITTAYQYAYAADGGRRWKKDIANNVWTWYPCGVACAAGALVEETSNLSGSTWTTSALYLRAGGSCSSQLIARNSEYHHADILGNYGAITTSTGSIEATELLDNFGVQRYSSGSAATQWIGQGAFVEEEGLEAGSGSRDDYLPGRDLRLQQVSASTSFGLPSGIHQGITPCQRGTAIGNGPCKKAGGPAGGCSGCCDTKCAAAFAPGSQAETACHNCCQHACGTDITTPPKGLTTGSLNTRIQLL